MREKKWGFFVVRMGRNLVVEYSDMPDDLMAATDAAGELVFRGGSIAIHIFDRAFVKRLGGDGAGEENAGRLPFHRADKKVSTLDEAGEPLIPDAPNAVKFRVVRL